MAIEPNEFFKTTNERNVFKAICAKAIKRCKKIKFYYESSGGKYNRTIEPYLIALQENGNVFVTGYEYPSPERKKKQNIDGQGTWLLNRIDLIQLEILEDTFNSIKFDPMKILGKLPTVKVLCRVSAKRMGIELESLV